MIILRNTPKFSTFINVKPDKFITMRNFLEKNMPGTLEFFQGFFGAMSNKTGSQSVRKWLAVGVYWIIFVITLRYTDKSNLIAVLTIHSSTFLSLVITYSVSTHKTKVLESKANPPKSGDKAEDLTT